MDSARKVALVPQQLLSTLMAQQQFNPAISQLNNMDYKMQNILQSSDVPSDIKHKQYNQMMHQYNTMRDQEINKPLSIDVKSSQLPDDDLIMGMPRNYRNKARLLLNHVKRAPNIGIDQNGQVIINGKNIPESNITDLIFDYAKPRKQGHAPAIGWREFGKALKQTNVPREAIVNINRWRDLDQPILAIHEDLPIAQPADLLEDEPFQTPEAKKIKTPSPVIRRSTRERTQTKPYSPPAWKPYNQKK